MLTYFLCLFVPYNKAVLFSRFISLSAVVKVETVNKISDFYTQLFSVTYDKNDDTSE